MAIILDAGAIRQIFPKAPTAILQAFVSDQADLARVGLLDTPTRLAYCLANLYAETSGFALKGLTENINYTATRMAQVWPNRFPSGAAVAARYGTATGWQKRAFDEIYGNRMGNQPGTSDGSRFIGRGGPQITGRDGYEQIGKRINVDLVRNPELATEPELQPTIAAAFWDWKKLNAKADAGDFLGCVKIWNGGTNGLSERRAQLGRILPIVSALPRGTAPAPTPANDNLPAPAGDTWAAFFSPLARLFKRKAA